MFFFFFSFFAFFFLLKRVISCLLSLLWNQISILMQFWRQKRQAGCRRHLSILFPNRKKLRINSYLIVHFPTSEGVSEVSERAKE